MLNQSSRHSMVYKVHKPAPPLSDHIDFFWFFEGLFPNWTVESVLPRGAFELVIDLRETPRKWFADEHQTHWREYRRGWISGAHSRFLVIDVLPDSSMIGAHFRPGGAAAFIPMPADELAGRVEEIDLVWGAAGTRLREMLLEAPSPERKFAILERFLFGRLQRGASGSSAMDRALRHLIARPSSAAISEIAGELGFSHKHFIALFRHRVGLTPKRFCRVRRFQEALAEIETRKTLDWARLAADTGYYDQAHFINDFTAFSGMNPSTYLTQRGEYMNFVPLDAR
jgi:AraC-like DNA-binding protein